METMHPENLTALEITKRSVRYLGLGALITLWLAGKPANEKPNIFV